MFLSRGGEKIQPYIDVQDYLRTQEQAARGAAQSNPSVIARELRAIYSKHYNPNS